MLTVVIATIERTPQHGTDKCHYLVALHVQITIPILTLRLIFDHLERFDHHVLCVC